MTELGGTVVIALLSLIATVDLAQFAITLRHERKISRLSTVQARFRDCDDGPDRC